MVLIPLLIPFYALLSLVVWYIGEGTLLLASPGFVGLSLLIAHSLFGRMNLRVDTTRVGIAFSAKVFILMNLIQLTSLVRYPFFRQTSSYEKIG